MEITWYGLGCFRIVERGYPVVLTDPFDEEAVGLRLPRASVDLVTMSTPSEEPERLHYPGASRVLGAPGEYELGGLFVTAIAALRVCERGAEQAQTLMYAFDFGGVTVCHLGEVGTLPTQSQMEMLGPVNVLLLPVGLPEGLTPGAASEVVSFFEPEIVVPMHYDVPGLRLPEEPAVRFLREMGVSQIVPVETLQVPLDSTAEETRIVVLRPLQA